MSFALIVATSGLRKNIEWLLEKNTHEPDDPQGTSPAHAGKAGMAFALALPVSSGRGGYVCLLRNHVGTPGPKHSRIRHRRGSVSHPRLRSTDCVAAADPNFQRRLDYD